MRILAKNAKKTTQIHVDFTENAILCFFIRRTHAVLAIFLKTPPNVLIFCILPFLSVRNPNSGELE